MKRYDSYKDSGVDWIGKIPSSWVKTKLKYKLQEVVTGGTPDTSNDSFWSVRCSPGYYLLKFVF